MIGWANFFLGVFVGALYHAELYEFYFYIKGLF